MMYQCGRCGLTRASSQEPIGSVLPQCKCPWEFTPPVMPQQRTTEPKRQLPQAERAAWVGLTDEEIEQGNKESWVTKQAFESAVWWAEAKLKEKNFFHNSTEKNT